MLCVKGKPDMVMSSVVCASDVRLLACGPPGAWVPPVKKGDKAKRKRKQREVNNGSSESKRAKVINHCGRMRLALLIVTWLLEILET